MPVGMLLDRFGIGRQFIAASFLVTAALSAVTPPILHAMNGNFGWLFAIRLAMGAV